MKLSKIIPTLLLPFFLAACQKQTIEKPEKAASEIIQNENLKNIILYAKQQLTAEEFDHFDWNHLKEVKKKDTIIAFIGYAKNNKAEKTELVTLSIDGRTQIPFKIQKSLIDFQREKNGGWQAVSIDAIEIKKQHRTSINHQLTYKRSETKGNSIVKYSFAQPSGSLLAAYWRYHGTPRATSGGSVPTPGTPPSSIGQLPPTIGISSIYNNNATFSESTIGTTTYIVGGLLGVIEQSQENNYDPYLYLASVQPEEYYDSPSQEWPTYIDFSENRVIYGTLYNKNSYPGIEKGFPWLWWENADVYNEENIELAFSNQHSLLLNLSQAIWVLRNKDMSRDVNDFIVEKDLDEPSFIAARTFIEQMLVQVATNPYDPEHLNILQANFNQVSCCLTGPVVLTGYVSELWTNVAFIKKEQPTWSWWRCYLEAQWDLLHFGLDMLGMVPVGGEVFDVINGAIYQMQGDGVNASLSYISAVPVVGWANTAAKYARKTIHLADGGRRYVKWFKLSDGSIYFGPKNSTQFRALLGLSKTDPRQAHHIIPWELWNDEVVQKAASGKFPFHLQDIMNGIPLSTTQRLGSHPNYTNSVNAALQRINTKYAGNINPEQAFTEITNLVDRIRQQILHYPNLTIE